MNDAVTQEQLRQVLDLQASLRDERARAASDRHGEIMSRLDTLTAQVGELVAEKRVANGRTAKLEQASVDVTRTLAGLPCVRDESGQCAGLPVRPKVVNWKHPGVVAAGSVGVTTTVYTLLQVLAEIARFLAPHVGHVGK